MEDGKKLSGLDVTLIPLLFLLPVAAIIALFNGADFGVIVSLLLTMVPCFILLCIDWNGGPIRRRLKWAMLPLVAAFPVTMILVPAIPATILAFVLAFAFLPGLAIGVVGGVIKAGSGATGALAKGSLTKSGRKRGYGPKSFDSYWHNNKTRDIKTGKLYTGNPPHMKTKSRKVW